jgi:hypothetical protein
MLQKVVVKKLSNKQIFDLLFREPTPEEKENALKLLTQIREKHSKKKEPKN